MCRVEWELWTSTNDGCGSSCDRQSTFKIQMRDAAVELQKVLPARPLSSARQSLFSSCKAIQALLSLCILETACVHRKEVVLLQNRMTSNSQPS